MKSTLTSLNAPPATGNLLIADGYAKLTQEDGKRAYLLAVILLFIITLISLRNIKLSLLFFLPLILATPGTFGLIFLTR